MTTPRIYVSALGAYNAGKLHGKWIDASMGEDHIWNEIQGMLASSPIYDEEEWAIHDHEGFAGWNVEEYSDIADIANIADLIERFDAEVVGYVLSIGIRPRKVHQFIADHYMGSMSGREDEYDWAWDYLEESGQMHNLPEWLSGHILDAAVHAWFDGLERGGEIRTVRDGSTTHIFLV